MKGKAKMANSITVTGGAGNFQLKSYIPEIYSPKLREKFWDNTLLRKICNTEFTGQFKNKGDTIVVRCLPSIPTSKFVAGQKINYVRPKSYDVKYTIDRGRYYAFIVDDVQKAFSDVSGWAEKWTSEGAEQLAQDEELEFFADIGSATKCHAKNTGDDTYGLAGCRSGGYKIGCVDHPVALNSGTPSEAHTANTGTSANQACDRTSPTEFITRLAAVLNEQPGGFGLNPFVVVPVWMTQMLQNSELKQADMIGDPVSLLRKDAVASIGKIANLTVYVSNLLPDDNYTLSYNTSSAATKSVKRYPIIFGDQSAITFADEVSRTEVLRDKDVPGDFHRSYHVYDWFPRYPERFGVGFVVDERNV